MQSNIPEHQKDLSGYAEAFTEGFSQGFSQGFTQGYAKAVSYSTEEEMQIGTFNLWQKSGDGALHGSFARPSPDSYKPNRGPYAGIGPKQYKRSDDKILDAVHEELTQHPEVDASEVEVQIKDGIVTLSGTIATRHMKETAADCLSNIAGIKEIHNELRIDTTTLTKSQTSQTGAEAALSRTVRQP